MKRYLVCLLLFWPLYNFSMTPISIEQIKFGTITENQTWSNTVYLIGDVTVPKNVTLTIQPGTTIHFSDYDILQSGKDKTKCEIIVDGFLDAQAQDKHPIRISQLNPSYFELLPENTAKTQVISFSPYQVETEPLRKEFRRFKNQYIVLWSLVYLFAYTQLTY